MKSLAPFVFVVVLVLAQTAMVMGYDVSFSSAAVWVAECDAAATVSVIRVSSGEGECWVDVITVPGSAAPGRDYDGTTGRVEFAAGQDLAQIVIPLVPDTVPEPNKTFLLVLQACSNCKPGVVTNCSVIIQDEQTSETMAQNFESGLPPGWCITTNSNEKGYWRFDNPGNRSNLTGGKGHMAIADSDAGHCLMDSELLMAPFAVASTALTYLVFKTHYVFWTFDIADVDLSLSGRDGPWTNLWRRQGADYPGPATEIIDLTPWACGQSNVMVRFHYYNADYDYYWQVDDVAILVEHDSNTNGLPDWWETAYYGGLTNLATRGDSDGDGASDGDEFIAGTHPRDTNSCFRAVGLTRSNATVTVQFPAELGHYYDLKSCTNLLNQSWTTRVARIQGMGGNTNLSLSAPGSNGFYRLDVRRW